jgi:hypothetical protein
VYKGIS